MLRYFSFINKIKIIIKKKYLKRFGFFLSGFGKYEYKYYIYIYKSNLIK